MTCGYPLPCPYHTVIIDQGAEPVPTVTFPVTAPALGSARARKRVIDVAVLLGPKKRRRRA